jgi:hypothetical protein
LVYSGFREARLIEESMPGQGWSADPTGQLVHISLKTLNYIGQAAENLVRLEGTDDCGWRQVVHPDDYHRVAARWPHGLKTGEPMRATIGYVASKAPVAGSAVLRRYCATTMAELPAGTVR